MTHSLVMRLSNSNPHTSGAQPPLPPKPAAHPRQSRRQENRRQHIVICATPAGHPYGEYVRLQIGVKERCRPKAGALCHCPLPLPLPPPLPPPLALSAPPAVRTGAHRQSRLSRAACVFENQNVQRVYPTCEPRVSCVCVLTLCVPAPPVSLYDYTMPVHIASATSRLPTFYAIAKNARRHQSGLLHTSTLHSTLQRRVHSAPPSPSCV